MFCCIVCKFLNYFFLCFFTLLVKISKDVFLILYDHGTGRPCTDHCPRFVSDQRNTAGQYRKVCLCISLAHITDAERLLLYNNIYKDIVIFLPIHKLCQRDFSCIVKFYCGTLVFSGTKYMMVKYQPAPEPDELIACFPEADVVLLEGFKYSEYPKIEVIRRGNSSRSVCDPRFLLGIVTDLRREELDAAGSALPEELPFFDLNETEVLSDWIYCLWRQRQTGRQ